MRLSDLFYSVATGSRRRRALLTPVGLLVFAASLYVVVFGGLRSDAALRTPRLFPGPTGVVVGCVLLAGGLAMLVWCVVWFFRAKGTPVPFNPPQKLVIGGPYALVRNPMLTGVFSSLFGLGFLLHSLSIVVFWAPAFVLLHVLELKYVEEPELVRRLGASYCEYRRRVPMFVPRLRRSQRRHVA